MLGVNELADVYIRADLVVRIQACDVRIDELRMPFERQGDTMVASLRLASAKGSRPTEFDLATTVRPRPA